MIAIPRPARRRHDTETKGRAGQMFLMTQEVTALYLWEHSIPAHAYVSGSICLIGDAAHATTPGRISISPTTTHAQVQALT